MTIARITIAPSVQPLADPNWRFATAGISAITGFVLAITDDDGHTGYGYARGTPPMEPPLDAVRAALELLTADLVGRDPAAIGTIMDQRERLLFGMPTTKAAIECALFDLRARALGVPLCDLFGGARRAALPQLRIVPLKPPDEMGEMAARLVGEGYRFLKIKASGDAPLDLARVREVRARAGAATRLMVDANMAYDPKGAIAAIARWAESGVELVEQPTPAHDLQGLALVAREAPARIEADESAQSLPEILRLCAGRMVDSINLRIPNLGGIRAALEAVAICESAGVATRFGAVFAPRLIQAQAAHVAATLPRVHFAHELAEFNHITNDPFDGLAIAGGELALPAGPGSGVTLRASPSS